MKRILTVLVLATLWIPQPAAGTEFLDRCFQDLCNCLCAPFTARRYEPQAVAVAPAVVAAPAPVYQVAPAPLAVAPAPVLAAPPPGAIVTPAPVPAPTFMAPAPTCAAEMSCEASCMAEMTCCAPAPAQPQAWVTYEVPQPSWWDRLCACLCPPRTPAAATPTVTAAPCGSGGYAAAGGYAAGGGYAYGYPTPPPASYASNRVPNGYEPGMIDFQVVSDEVVGESKVADGAPERPAPLGPSVGDPTPRNVAEGGDAELLPSPGEVRGIPVSH